MGLVQNLQLLNIKLVCWLGWLSCFAFAQFDISEGVSGFVNIPVQGITCLGNLAVFVTSLIRGRLDLEIGARDVLDILVSAKLKTINGIGDGNGLTTYTEGRQTASTERVCFQKMIQLCRRLRHRLGIQKMVELFRRLRHQLGIEKMVEFFRRLQHRLGINVPCSRGEEDLQTLSIEQGDLHIASAEEGPPPTTSNENGSVQPTASVVLLSYGKPNLSIKEFMKTNAPIVDSILLRFLPLQDAINDGEVVTPEVNIETCPCNSCNCIVFWTLEELTIMLALRMPGTLKPLSNSLCLLPCLTCLKNCCHGCNWDSLLRVEGPFPLEQDDEGHRVRVNESKVVSEILDDISARSINPNEHICICIPTHGASSDVWTELLVRSLRSKDAEGRGVRVMASEALEGYLAGRRGGSTESVEYNIVSFVMPRLTEVLINLLLTFWLGVDGFSSSLVARRTIRDYLVDSKGSGFAANAFLTKALVKSDFNNTQVCQVLSFRGDLLGIKTLSFIVGCVNLLCSIGWSVLISFEADISLLPYLPAVMTVAFSIVLFMDSAIILTRFSWSGYWLFTILYIISILLFTIFDRSPYIAIPIALIGLEMVSRFFNWKYKKLVFMIFLISIAIARFLGLSPFFELLVALLALVIMWSFLKASERIFLLVIFLELGCVRILLPILWGDVDHMREYGRQVYGVVQTLVWAKWTTGSYILSKKNSLEFMGKSPHGWGLLVYSSAFFLNAVLAGVRSTWDAPWTYTISRKHHY